MGDTDGVGCGSYSIIYSIISDPPLAAGLFQNNFTDSLSPNADRFSGTEGGAGGVVEGVRVGVTVGVAVAVIEGVGVGNISEKAVD